MYFPSIREINLPDFKYLDTLLWLIFKYLPASLNKRNCFTKQYLTIEQSEHKAYKYTEVPLEAEIAFFVFISRTLPNLERLMNSLVCSVWFLITPPPKYSRYKRGYVSASGDGIIQGLLHVL